MSQIKLSFSPLPYPYKEEHDSNIIWGEISLDIYDQNGQVLKNIFYTHWDVRPLITWLQMNKECILQDEFPQEYDFCASGSLLEKEAFFNNFDGELIDAAYDAVFEYKEKHNLRFGLKGCDIRSVFLGINNGQWEVSFFEDRKWQFKLDLNELFKNVEEISGPIDYYI